MIPMKQRSKLPRRMTALALSGAAVWMIASTADLPAAWQALRAMADGPALVTALLEAELGELENPLSQAGLEGLLRAAVEDTPALAAEGQAVAAWLTGTAQEAVPQSPAASSGSPPPEESAAEPEAASSGGLPPEAEPSSSSGDLPPEEGAVPSLGLDLSAIDPGEIDVTNHTDSRSVDVAAMLNADPALSLRPASEGPQILIIHTHATEAYAMDGEDVYEESDNSRTTDENYNMIRIGEEMKSVFESHGLSVVHDKTTYDYPGYNGSYNRALEGIQSYLEQYPTISVVLDVHRDALIGSDGTVYSKTTTIGGERVAQVMLVIGSNDSGLSHPNWTENMTLAVHVQAAMLALDPSFPRSIDLRSQRFNQQTTLGSLLVEVGTSGNTLKEAVRGARLFAEAASDVFLGQME